MKKILYIFFILLSFNTFSQSTIDLKGRVVEVGTDEPLAGTYVNFGKSVKPIIVDENGDFHVFLLEGEYDVVVKLVGYKNLNQRIQINTSSSPLILKLEKRNVELEEVVISANNSIQQLDKPVMGVNTVKVKDIKKMPMPLGEVDVLKGLQMMPGVSSVGEASNGLNIRGGTTDQNLMLLEDTPIFNPTHMFGLFSAFPSDGVSSVDIYKGNVPANYSGRTASVLDINLATPSLTKFHLDGGISLVSNKLRMDIPLIQGKLGLMVSGRGSYNDLLLPVISEDLKGIKANFADLTSKLFFLINEKNILSVTNYYSYDFFQTDLLGSYKAITSTSNQFKNITNNYSAKWSHLLDDQSSFQAIFASAFYQPDMILPEVNSDNDVVISQSIDFKQLKLNYNKTKKDFMYEVGVDFTHYTINPGTLNPGSSSSVNPKQNTFEYGLETGAYITSEWNIGEKIKLSTGLRYSNYMNLGPSEVRSYDPNLPKSQFTVVDSKTYAKGEVAQTYGGFEPRLGLNYKISDYSNFKLGYNIARQYLEQISNTTTPLPTSRWKLADYNILPQISQLISGGYTHNSFDQRFQFGLEAYYRGTQNVMDFKPGAEFLLKDFPETEILQGFNKSYGVEFMVSKEKGLATGWFNYTYARSLNQINVGPADIQKVNFGNWYSANYDRPHNLNISLVIGQGKHHDFSFNFTYSTGRPYTTPQGFVQYQDKVFPYFSERNNIRIPDYHRLDFAWNIYNPRMDPKKRFKGNWVFSVYNIYGRKNPYSIFYRSEGMVLNSYKLVIFGSPIPTLAYKCTFD
ncbi:MAG: hypothetical protein RIR51_2153 [Bacteroidota bacterium]